MEQVIEAMRRGDAEKIGALMDESQRLFDEKIAGACPSEFDSPLLHAVMADPEVRRLSLGVKGVGSHGDGTVQMICRDRESQEALCAYLNGKGMDAYVFTIKRQRSVRKAVIPAAGFGTRMFPATKVVKKELFPVVDRDGIAKPALLVLLQELEQAGIEEVALVGSSERAKRVLGWKLSTEISRQSWSMRGSGMKASGGSKPGKLILSNAE